jgi:uncharacterized protein (TIGR00645 family)
MLPICYFESNKLEFMTIEKRITKAIEWVIFSSKWLLIPFFLKLFITLANLLNAFIVHGHLSNEDLMSTLEDVDIVMVACLVKMIITGSYNSFISKDHGRDSENVSSGLLKVKMATSIVGVTTIHMLQIFVAITSKNPPTWDTIYKQSFIHAIFIIGALMLALIDLIHHKTNPHH